jgi:hypothetical protein
MAAHAPDQPTHEQTAGAGLLPLFALAVVLATVAISTVVAVPSMVTAIIALSTVIGFAAALVAMLGRLIGPEEH